MSDLINKAENLVGQKEVKDAQPGNSFERGADDKVNNGMLTARSYWLMLTPLQKSTASPARRVFHSSSTRKSTMSWTRRSTAISQGATEC